MQTLKIVKELRNKPNFVLEDISLVPIRNQAINELNTFCKVTLSEAHQKYLEDQEFLMNVVPRLKVLEKNNRYVSNILNEIKLYYRITNCKELPEDMEQLLLALDQETRKFILRLVRSTTLA